MELHFYLGRGHGVTTVPHPIGRSAELGMLWIAVEEYDERNI